MNSVRLEELCEAIVDCPHSTPTWTKTGIPVVRNFNLENTVISLDSPSYVDEADYQERIRRAEPREGDLILSREAPMGKVGLVPAGLKCCLGQRLVLLRPNRNLVDSRYLLIAMTSEFVQIQIRRADVAGSIVSNLSLPQIRDLQIPLVENAADITKLLGAIDDKIAMNKRLCAELEETAQLVYDYWFTQFDFPDENGKPYRSSGGKMTYDPTLKREIPAGWSANKLGTILEGIRTGLNPRDNFRLTDQGNKYITVKNLTVDGSLDFATCDYIDDAAQQLVHRRSDVSKGDVLFASISPLGRCYLVQSDPVDWDINESVFSVRANTELTASEYIYMLLKSEWFIRAAEGSSAGSVFKGIRNEELRGIILPIPPKAVADAFASKVSPILELATSYRSQTHALVELRDWLLPMLMNGRAKVSAEEAV